MTPAASARTDVSIHWLVRDYLSEVLAIEQQSFDFAWTEEDFLRCLRQRNIIGMVADCLEGNQWKAAGFMVYELLPRQIRLLNFAVHPGYRRRSAGTQMVAKLKSKLGTPTRRTRLTLEVRETNLAAQLFFRRQGFKAVRVLPGYYEDSGEDAYRMEYLLEG